MTASILIVENHVSLQKSLQDWLTIDLPPGCVVEVADCKTAFELIPANSSQLIIIDLDTSQAKYLELMQHVKAIAPQAKIVTFGLDEHNIQFEKAKKAGAIRYIPKSMLQNELIPTLENMI